MFFVYHMFDQTTDILLKIPASHSVVQICGEQMKIQDNSIITKCPECSSRMFSQANSFLCENYVCSLKTATPLEYLATTKFKKDLSKAYDYYLKLIDPKNKIVLDKHQAVTDLILRRRLLQLVIDSFVEPNQTFDDITINGWLRTQGINIANIQSVAVVWNQDKLNKYLGLVGGFDLKKIPSCDYYLVVPFFTSPSSLGGILFTSPDMQTPVMHVLSSKKYMWAGLLKNSRVFKEYLVTSSFSNLIELIGSNRLFITDQIPLLCVYVNPAGFDYDFIPENIHYLFDTNTDILATGMTSMSIDCSSFRVGDINKCPTSGNACTWDSFLERYISASIKKFGLSSSVLCFIDSCSMSPAQEYRVLNKLMLNGFGSEATKLKTHFSNKIIFSDMNTIVSQRSDGYVVVTGKANKKISQISNFTLDVERNIAFPDQKKVISEALVNFKDQQIKVWIPLDSLETANSVEDSVRTAWIVNENSKNSEDAIPLIINKLDYRKFITPYTRNIASRCPYLQGISFLGWDFNKTKFQGPGWSVDAAGIQRSESILYPDSDFLNCFVKKDPIDELSDEISINEKTAISVIVGIIGRGFFDKITNGIKSSSELNEELTNMLFSLGQNRYLSPDSREIKISQNNGFPVGVIHTSDFYRMKTISPVIDLDRSSNLSLSGTFRPYIFHIVAEVIKKLINQQIEAPERFSSCDILNTLTQEGIGYINQALGVNWDIKPTTNYYDTLFSGITKEEIQKEVVINPSSGTVRCKIGKLRSTEKAISYDDKYFYLPLTEFTSNAYAFYGDNNLEFDYDLPN